MSRTVNRERKRGQIFDQSRYSQKFDFSNLRFGKSTPSDLDFVRDIRGQARVPGEFKSGSTQLPFGQLLSFERLLKSCHESHISTLGFVARHDSHPDEIVFADECLVSEFWLNPHDGWQRISGNRRLGEFIQSWRVWDLKRRTGKAS